MKKILILSFCAFQIYVSFSQTNQKTILLVPFDHKFYNNEEATEMAKRSGFSYEQMKQSFQKGVDSTIVSVVQDSITVIDFFNGFTQNVSSDLELIHGAAMYQMENRPTFIKKKKTSLFVDRSKSTETINTSTATDTKGELQKTPTDVSNKFMSVKFEDVTLVNKMTMKYKAKYLVFITEFDLKADYALNQRNITVHYAIFRSDGKFIYGDCERKSFPASENNPAKISAKYLPEIAILIARHIP